MNSILKNLYVGDMSEVDRAKREGMSILSVMWGEEDGSPEGVMNIQTTRFFEQSPYMNGQGYATLADCEKLNEAADWIHAQSEKGERVFVHCAFGMERSPLTVVWYLIRYHGYSIDEAYRFVKVNRPMTQDRRQWLPMNWETMVRDRLEG